MPNVAVPPEIRQALSREPDKPVRVLDSETQAEYVLVTAELFDRLTSGSYDDSPWTKEEQAALAARAGLAIGWADMDEYDNYPDASK